MSKKFENNLGDSIGHGGEISEVTPQVKDRNPVERVGVKVLSEAVGQFGAVFKKGRETESGEGATMEEKKEVGELLVRLGGSLSALYKEIKRLSKIVPVLFMLLGPGHKVDEVEKGIVTRKTEVSVPIEKRKLSHISTSQLPFLVGLVNRYMEGNIINEYNKMVDFFNNRVDGKMTNEEIAYKERIAQTIQPFGYFDSKDSKSINSLTSFPNPISKLKDFENGERSFTKENMHNLEPKYRIRIDIFRTYLGLSQFNSSLKESSYRPTKSKDLNTKYFSFENSSIIKDIKKNSILRALMPRPEGYHSKNNSNLYKKINTFEDLKGYILKYGEFPPCAYLEEQLGAYGSYIAYDKERKEEYVSYYDLWDLEPSYLKDLAININNFNFPVEIYGRIYESEWNSVSGGSKK